MKSFFKKLAFVMALAMVVSLAAPAAAKTAYAASNITISYQNEKSTITELNIAKVGQSEDLKFVGAPSNWKSLNPTWKSSDESVATVDQNGNVTAVAAGTAVITFTCGDQSASVKVNCVNTATYTATIGVASDKNMSAKTIEVGDVFDFAFYGIKDYSADRYYCTWASDDTSVATVDQKGLVTAVKPGTAKITLIVFNKVTGQVHNVAPVLVTVPGAEATPTPTQVPVDNSFTVVQKNSDTVEVTFANKEITDAAINLVASYENGNVKNDNDYISVSEVKDGVVTVKFYNGLAAGYTYTLTNDTESTTFVASTGVVDKIVISYKCCNTQNIAYAGQTVNLSAKVYSGDVEVTASNGVSFKYISSLFGSESVGTSFYAVQAGEVVTVTATYYNTGSNVPVTATLAIPVLTAPEYRMKTSDAAMEIRNSLAVSYNGSGSAKISVSDLGRYMVFKTEDILGNTIYGNTDATGAFYSNGYGIFRFTTTNDTVLGVSESNGALYPRSAGTALIQVWFVNSSTGTKTLVGTKQVTVYGARVLNVFTLNKTSSNNMASNAAQQYAMIADLPGADSYNTVSYEFTTKDQLGDKIQLANNTNVLWITYDDPNNDTGAVSCTTTTSNGKATFTFTSNVTLATNVAYKDVELTLHAKDSVEKTMKVVIRIFNVNYANRGGISDVAFIHSTSASGLGVLDGKTAAQVLKAGVVEFENNAYNDAEGIVGMMGDAQNSTSVWAIVNAANAAKASIANSQNVTPAQQTAIASATALVNSGWYYVVKDGYTDVSANATLDTATNIVQYTVRAAAAGLSSSYRTDNSVSGGSPVTVVADVYDTTKWGKNVTFTFYKVVYNQYTSRYEYVTKTVSKSLTNSDRATIGGTAVVQATRVTNNSVSTLEDFVKNYIHVSVFDKSLGRSIELCNNANCYKTNWGGRWTLTGVVTNGQGVYNTTAGDMYYDSQTVNRWAYIVSLLVTYSNNGEVVTVEIPVNARVEW